MAIQFVGGNTAAKAGATSGSTTIALNSGLTGGIASSVAADDLVIAVFATGSAADRTLAITDGANNYTLIGSELYANASTYDVNFRVAYKFMGSTPDASTTFGPTGNAADAGTMAVYVFRGVDQTTPLDGVTPTTASSTFNPSANPPTITPSSSGAFIVCAGATAHGGGTLTFSSSDLTDFLSIGSNDNNDSTLGIGHKDDWTSGAFDAAAFTHAIGGNASWAALSLVLRPAPAALSLAADGGSFAFSGVAADLERGREVAADTGSFAFTGTNANLEYGREVAAGAGSYAFTGTDAALEYGFEIAAGAGAYALTGTDANLEYGRKVIADAGTYGFTGTDANLEYGRKVTADAGSYAFTGVDASLEYGREITAGAGSYVFTGTDATLTKEGGVVNRDIVADAGAFSFTGTDATLQYAAIAPVTEQPQAGWSDWLNNIPRPRQAEDEPKPKRKKRRKRKPDYEPFVPAPDPLIERGIVNVPPAWDVMVQLQQMQAEAEMARLERLRAIALADDEWLMMA